MRGEARGCLRPPHAAVRGEGAPPFRCLLSRLQVQYRVSRGTPGLRVLWQGPNAPKGDIPRACLWHWGPALRSLGLSRALPKWVEVADDPPAGLHFEFFEGLTAEGLPDFDACAIAESGTALRLDCEPMFGPPAHYGYRWAAMLEVLPRRTPPPSSPLGHPSLKSLTVPSLHPSSLC